MVLFCCRILFDRRADLVGTEDADQRRSDLREGDIRSVLIMFFRGPDDGADGDPEHRGRTGLSPHPATQFDQGAGDAGKPVE